MHREIDSNVISCFLNKKSRITRIINVRCWVQTGFDSSYTTPRIMKWKNTAMSPAGPGNKNDCAGVGQQKFTWPINRLDFSGSCTETEIEMKILTALRTALCHEDLLESFGIIPPFLTSALDTGECSTSCTGKKAPIPIGYDTGWTSEPIWAL